MDPTKRKLLSMACLAYPSILQHMGMLTFVDTFTFFDDNKESFCMLMPLLH